jgi:DNA repair exonuclease SbcCD ATPase subunit
MIVFEKLRWKNFLSTGNAFSEITLNKAPTTLVVGKNGSGKSTMLDALTYALFNKPFRNINKPQLVNSVNDKKLVVEVEFSIGATKYLIRRGAKPTVFEIFVNGTLLNQDASSRDYQKYLEEHILKLNFKSFTQIVILGSASFTPFMQLPQAQRREIIEDLLDIRVFSTMNVVLRQHMSDLKDKMVSVEGELEVHKQKAVLQKKYIDTLTADKEKEVQRVQEKIDDSKTTVQKFSELSEKLELKKETLGDVEGERRLLDSKREEFERALASHQKDLEFYHNNDDCPTCKQGIPHEFKSSIQEETGRNINELETSLEELSTQFEIANSQYQKFIELQNAILKVNAEIISEQRIQQQLMEEVETLSAPSSNIENEMEVLKSMAKDVVEKNKSFSDHKEQRHYYDVVASLLKDSGIKTKIIKYYVPIINKLVNKFLSTMDFFVQFELDDTFKETLKSRFRDKFSYANFSEGEKQRIDLALLFTWRAIAKMKNSANTNLLILDEVFDGSLDGVGMEHLMNLLNIASSDSTNVFVITHRGDQFFDKFHDVVSFQKKNNYSLMSCS